VTHADLFLNIFFEAQRVDAVVVLDVVRRPNVDHIDLDVDHIFIKSTSVQTEGTVSSSSSSSSSSSRVSSSCSSSGTE